MSYLLSKSKYIRGLQCRRALWLDVHSPRLARYSAEQMRLFDRGRSFEYNFKATFPDGIDVSAALGHDINAYPAHTATLLDGEGEVSLFEAGFLYDDVLVLADVVQKHADGRLDIYEVKSGNTMSDTYKRDAALQHYVISHCREVATFSIVYNDGLGGFVTEEFSEEFQSAHDEIATNIAAMKDVVLASTEPDITPGGHCLTPYACPYQHHCNEGCRQLGLF